MLKFHKVIVRPVTGHYNADGDLVDEEIGGEAAVFTADQFEQYLAAVKDHVEKRNQAEAKVVAD